MRSNRHGESRIVVAWQAKPGRRRERERSFDFMQIVVDAVAHIQQ
jgi:hypothetical protein